MSIPCELIAPPRSTHPLQRLRRNLDQCCNPVPSGWHSQVCVAATFSDRQRFRRIGRGRLGGLLQLSDFSVSGSDKPLNVSTAYLLNIFLVPLQRFNDSRRRWLNLECLDTTLFTRHPVHPAQTLFTLHRSPKSLPRIYRKRLTMHEIKCVANGSMSGREDFEGFVD